MNDIHQDNYESKNEKINWIY